MNRLCYVLLHEVLVHLRHGAGYMDGAIEAGERAAREILHHLGRLKEGDIYREEAFQEGFIPDAPICPPAIERWLPSVGGFLLFCTAALTAVAAAVVALYA